MSALLSTLNPILLCSKDHNSNQCLSTSGQSFELQVVWGKTSFLLLSTNQGWIGFWKMHGHVYDSKNIWVFFSPTVCVVHPLKCHTKIFRDQIDGAKLHIKTKRYACVPFQFFLLAAFQFDALSVMTCIIAVGRTFPIAWEEIHI